MFPETKSRGTLLYSWSLVQDNKTQEEVGVASVSQERGQKLIAYLLPAGATLRFSELLRDHKLTNKRVQSQINQ